MRILFLSRWFPFPPNNGSKLRIYHLLHSLAREHEVSLISFENDKQLDTKTIREKTSIMLEVVRTVPWSGFKPNRMKARLGYLSPYPRSIIDTYSPEMAHSIEKTIKERKYDLVIASQIDTAAYRRQFGDLIAIFEEVEVGRIFDLYQRAKSPEQRFRYWLTWEKYRRYLSQLMRNYQVCTVVSENERDLLGYYTIIPSHDIEVIPNCVNLEDYKQVEQFTKPNTLIFTGSLTYLPNYAGINWFLRDVFPQVQRQIPTVELTITGDHAGLTLPPINNVRLTGYVDDIRPYLSASAVSVTPIFEGGGTRIKILEAMAAGIPVVSTTKGAEGLDVDSGVNILLADTPDEFGRCVLMLLMDVGFRTQLSSNAYELIQKKYDWAVVKPRFLWLVEKTANL